jgi:hypothetical protein
MASGSTTNYDLPYPVPSDPVNFTEDMEALAVAIEATLPGFVAQSQLSDHLLDTTNVHGISNTSNLVYTNATSLINASGNPVSVTQNQVTNLISDLALKAPISSPQFTGIPQAPTALSGTNTDQIATTQFVQTAVTGTGQVPSVSGQAGKYLYTDGTNAFWQEYQDTQLPSVIVSTNTVEILDSFDGNAYRSAEYLIQADQANTSKKTLLKMLIIHDDSQVYQTTYGIIEVGSTRIPMEVFATINNFVVDLKVEIQDADTDNVQLEIVRTLVTV